MNTDLVVSSREILARKARSFRVASWFLPREARDAAAVLYALCREIDDLADEAPDPIAADVALYTLRMELVGRARPRALVVAFHDLTSLHTLDVKPVLDLIDGVSDDLGEVVIADDRALLRYCYRVAGTVGVLMCGILGVTERRALAHAVDLGVAMQLTNIARDVAEDAGRGRCYLPDSRLRAVGTDGAAVIAGTAPREAVIAVTRDLLQLADRYYESAEEGMAFIPWRSRAAIRIAARLYQGIGHRLLRQGANPLVGRTVTTVPERLASVGAALWTTVTAAVREEASGGGHEAALHAHLRGLIAGPVAMGGGSR